MGHTTNLAMPNVEWPTISIALYVWLILGLSMLAIYAIKSQPNIRRRIFSIIIAGALAHGLWWVSYLNIPADAVHGINPWITGLSQLAASISMAMALRLQIARASSESSIVFALASTAAITTAVILTLSLGLISLGVGLSSHNLWESLAWGLILPSVLTFLCMVIRPVGPTIVRILSSSGLAAMAITSALYGLKLAFDFSVSVQQPVSFEWALMIALGVCAGFAILLLGAAIWQSRQQFITNMRSAIEALPLGLALFDERDRLIIWNKAFSNLNDLPYETLRPGMSYRTALKVGMISRLYPPEKMSDPEWLEEMAMAHRAGDALHQTTDGKQWIKLQHRNISHHGLVTIALDYTEQKKREAEVAVALEQARSASLAKSRFLANMSHEIRTPLNGVVAIIEALSRSKLTPNQAEMVELVRSSSDTLQRLLSDILDMARIESGQVTITRAPFDLARLVNETQKIYASTSIEKGVQLFSHITPSAQSWVMGDALRTRQILNNLLSNAVKFTDEGHISLFVKREGENIVFRVDDTGIGFEQSNIEHLFGRFQQNDEQITRRYGGSGLGLSICAELVDIMGGSISGTSQPGQGASFTVLLPIPSITTPMPETGLEETAQDLTRTAQQLSQPGGPKTKKLRILLADDNATNRRVVELILSNNSSTDLVEVENGEQALETYQNQSFDLVLMDMQMPIMDGLTATRSIREFETCNARPHTPLIMLTANAMPEHVTASIEAGADAHLAKPFSVGQFLELTHRLTQKEQAIQ